MTTYRVNATLGRTLGTTTIEADSLEEALEKANELEYSDFDQADDHELFVDDVSPE